MISRVSRRVAVSVVYVAAMFMTIMDVTIVNVAQHLRRKPKPAGRAAQADLAPGQGSVQA